MKDSAMDISFKKTNGPLDDLLNEILSMAEVNHPEIIREMLISALKTGQEDALHQQNVRSVPGSQESDNLRLGENRSRRSDLPEVCDLLEAVGTARLHGDYGGWPRHHAGG
jgi:hypothetical protein